MLRSLAMVALVSTTAAAETTVSLEAPPEGKREVVTPALGFGAATPGATVDDVALVLQTGPNDTRVTATFTLASTAKRPEDTLLVLDVPAGAQVTYLGMELAGQHRIARLVASANAHVEYEDIVRYGDDPAVLEWAARTPASERLRLRVFPMQRGQKAKIELIMTVPAAAALAISPGPRVLSRVRVEVDGTAAAWRRLDEVRTIALPEQIAASAPAEAEHVDLDHSLFVGLPSHWAPAEVVPEPPRVRRGAVVITEECLRNPIAPTCD